MFGFVRPADGKLSEEQKNIFKSYYCGVCKSMERRYTHAARFTLTYDCTFLALLLTEINCLSVENSTAGCVLRKKPIVIGDAIDYAADINIMLAYYKLDDDVNDDKSQKARLAKAVLKSGFDKAKKANPDVDRLIKSNLEYLYLLEKEKCNEPDKVADAFGRLLEGIVGYGSNMNKTAMGLGYALGKYIYLLDAFVDYEKDIKSGSYNVFALRYGKIDSLKEEIAFLMEATLSEMIGYYKELKIVNNKEILDNILYLGIIQELLKAGQKDKALKREIE